MSASPESMNGSLVIPEEPDTPDLAVSWGAEERERSWLETVRRDTDWMFAWLLICQWLIGRAVTRTDRKSTRLNSSH